MRLWTEIWKKPQGCFAIIVLVMLYGLTFFAPLIAPYDTREQHLKLAFHPPMRLCWKNSRLCYYVYEKTNPALAQYSQTSKYCPIKFWVPCKPYKILGLIQIQHRLFSGEADHPCFLLGSDNLGRDCLSRLLWGGRVSLSIGIIGVSITLTIGCFIGCLAGYFGGWIDVFCMRFIEFLMAIPSLYLLLALRASLGSHFNSAETYLMIVTLLACIGWTKIARVVRGIVASLKHRAFVQAAQAMGQNTFCLLKKHFLPNLVSYLLAAATLCIPHYILYEAALSFLGLGIQEPSASWGLMLKYTQEDLKVFTLNFWWLLIPGIGIATTIVAFNLLGDTIRDLVDPNIPIDN